MMISTFYDHVLSIAIQEGIEISQVLKLVKSLGVDLMEVSSNNVWNTGLKEMKTMFEKAELGTATVCAYFDFTETASPTEDDLKILDAAEFLGAKKILIIPGFFNVEDSEEEKERKTKNIIAATKVVSDGALRRGIIPVMEEYDDVRAPFRHTSGLLRFLEEIDTLGCAFDTGNFIAIGEDAFEAYDKLKDKIRHVHLKDRALSDPKDGSEAKIVGEARLYPCPVGYGDIKIDKLIEQIKAGGYSDIFTVEHYDSPDVLGYLKKSMSFLDGRL